MLHDPRRARPQPASAPSRASRASAAGQGSRIAIDRLTTCRSSIYGLVEMEFRRPSYFALATLIDGPLHGYAIVRRASQLSDGAVRLSTGTLYALLERAIVEGLVVAGEPYREGGRMRRDYRLTESGRSELAAEAERLSNAGRTVARRLRATAKVVSQ
jgi:PadR family transcriptional regulator PadR